MRVKVLGEKGWRGVSKRTQKGISQNPKSCLTMDVQKRLVASSWLVYETLDPENGLVTLNVRRLVFGDSWVIK